MTTRFSCIQLNITDTPHQLIKRMLTSTHNTILYVCGFPYDENDDSNCIYRCIMNWPVCDTESIVRTIVESENFENSFFSNDILIRTERLKNLVSCKAPKIVIDNELLLLTMAKALNYFAVNIETITIK